MSGPSYSYRQKPASQKRFRTTATLSVGSFQDHPSDASAGSVFPYPQPDCLTCNNVYLASARSGAVLQYPPYQLIAEALLIWGKYCWQSSLSPSAYRAARHGLVIGQHCCQWGKFGALLGFPIELWPSETIAHNEPVPYGSGSLCSTIFQQVVLSSRNSFITSSIFRRMSCRAYVPRLSSSGPSDTFPR